MAGGLRKGRRDRNGKYEQCGHRQTIANGNSAVFPTLGFRGIDFLPGLIRIEQGNAPGDRLGTIS
jgi:hypothetical protein